MFFAGIPKLWLSAAYEGVIRMKTFQRIPLFLALIFITSAAFGSEASVRYFRHIALNHNSPYIPYAFVNEISAEQAKTVEHYEVVFDGSSRIAEIRNYSSEAWHTHPLTHLGAFRTAISYDGEKAVRQFYDKDGKRVQNLRKVYKEIASYDKDGFLRGLEFLDLQDRPMDSNWGVARYAWEKKGDLIIERRYNVKGEFAPLAPSFQFHISGLKFDGNGRIESHCNLNDNLEVANSVDSIACYKDVYAADGNLLGLTYYDKDGQVVNSQWKFAVVRLTYDKDGNAICEDMTDKNGMLVHRTIFAYDASGKLIENLK